MKTHREALNMKFYVDFEERKKRKTRPENELQRNFSCPAEDCRKSFTCISSLNKHMRVKHLECYKAQMQDKMHKKNVVIGVTEDALTLPSDEAPPQSLSLETP